MITSKTTKHKQCSVLDRSLIVGGLENIMVDGRGKVRPFGLRRPSFSPTVTPIDGKGNLSRGIGYSYLYTYYDSRNDAESQPSPASDYAIVSAGEDYRLVSIGEYSTSGYDDSVVLLQGSSLSKEDGHYNNCCISVHVVNDDRRAEYNQWQYRKVVSYTYESSTDTGRFVVSRPFINVDSDPEDQQSYEVKLSDLNIEEGSVGGNSTSKYKVVLDPTSSTDVASYRLKVIRITSGKGEGQTRIIADAALNKDGLVECTVSKPFKKKPFFIDPNDPEVQKKHAEYPAKDLLKPQYFKKWFSSEYVIYDPLRSNGICVDCEVTGYDKKTGIVSVGGLGNGQNLINGSVVEYGVKNNSPYIVLSTVGYSGNFSSDSTLVGRRLRITQGPGRGREYLIESIDSDYKNDGSFKCFLSCVEGYTAEDGLSSHLPNGKSEYCIFSDNGFSSSELALASAKPSKSLDTISFLVLDPSRPGSRINIIKYCSANDKPNPWIKIDPSYLDERYQDIANFFDAFVTTPSYVDFRPSTGAHLWYPECNFKSRVLYAEEVQDSKYGRLFKVSFASSNLTPKCKEKNFEKWNKFHNVFNLGAGTCSSRYEAEPTCYVRLKDADPEHYSDGLLYRLYINSLDNITLTPDDVSSGSYCFTFMCRASLPGGKYIYVKRTLPVVGIGTDTAICLSPTPYVDVFGEFPKYKTKSGDVPVEYDFLPCINEKGSSEAYNCSFSSNNLMDGYYCGWRAFFYNNDDTVTKPKQKYKEGRVHAYFDATGQLLVSGDIAGIKSGWQCVLFSEYTSCLGSAINSGLCSYYYPKSSLKPVGYYSDYVPLLQFADAEEDDDGNIPYEGWTLLVLSSAKEKKSGVVKYTAISEKKANNRSRTVVKYFPESRRAYVHYEGEGGAEAKPDYAGNSINAVFNPMLSGSEQVWLFDESTAIDAVFNQDGETDSEQNADIGCKMKIEGIVACPYDGVDKIRLYRASETASTFLRVVELDNKNQDYEDNISEEFLLNPVDYSHAPLPPSSCCCSYKDRYVCGGSVIKSLGISPKVDIIAPSSGFFAIRKHSNENPVVEGYDYVSEDGTSLSVDSSSVAIGVSLSNDCRIEFPADSKCNVDKLNFSLVLGRPSSNGVVMRCERSFNYSIIQRSPANNVKEELPNVSYEDHFYLSRGCDTTPSVYDGCLLSFTDSASLTVKEGETPKEDVKHVFPFVVAGQRNFIPSSRRFNFYEPSSSFDQSKGVFHPSRRHVSVPLPVQTSMLYPIQFAINGTYWRLEYKDGKYYLYDNEHASTPVEASVTSFECGSETLDFVSFPVLQGDKCNPKKYILGGDPSACVPASIPDESPTRPSLVSSSSAFKFYALSISEENNTLVSAWTGSSFAPVSNEPEKSWLSTFSISGKNEYSKTASGYCPYSSLHSVSSLLSGSDYVYDLLYLGRHYQSRHDGGSSSFSCNYGGNFVFITDPVDGCTEKYTITNTFSFYDEYGTNVVALANHQIGIIVFKERGVYVLNPDEGSIVTYSADTGCIASDSVCAGRDDIYWLSGDMRVYVCNFKGASRWISKNIHPWFEGLVDFDGWWVCTDKLSESKACYDYEDSQYILFVPATTVKGASVSDHYLCFLFSTEFNQIFRLEDPLTLNEVNCAFRFKSHFGLATSKGVYVQDKIRTDSEGKQVRPSWFYHSNLRFEGSSLFKKLVKRVCITSYIDKTLPDSQTASIFFTKNMDDAQEPSHQAEDGHAIRKFFTNKFSQLIHVGIRAIAWQFRMFGAGYVKIHDFVLELRSKNEDEVGFHDTPN